MRTLYHPHDSEDATQEILVKVITKPSTFEELDVAYGEIYRHHPFYDAPDFVASLRALIDEPRFRTIMELT